MTFKTLITAAAAAFLSTVAVQAQEVTLRFQHFVSPQSAGPKNFMAPWAEKVMADSKGRIKIELYPAMQLGGSPASIYDQVRDGVIDGGWVLPGYMPGRFPEAEAFELPFMTLMSAEKSSRAAWEYAQKHLLERTSDVHLIAVHVHGPGFIHKKGDAITSIDQMNGLKLRGPSRTANKLLEAMGAVPVGMPVPAFPENLSKGVIDGGLIPMEIVPSLKIDELADSHTGVAGDNPMYNTFFFWAMNKDSYAKLPDDLKAVIDANSGADASAWFGRGLDTGDVVGLEKVKATDNTLHVLSEEETAKLRALSEPLIEAWIAEMEAAGLPGRQMVEDARAAIAAVSE